ncbi:MAG: hypothetical protein GY749_07540 [Desulfobacteraceae bacterium]|nr:hypothetical protein [Desulfobacteraceae bacterium]
MKFWQSRLLSEQNKIILTLSEGNFEQGFAALLRIQDDKRISLCEISGKLPGSVEKSFRRFPKMNIP